MSDIVERLREFYIPAPDDLPGYDLGICEEAAAEIERLTKQNDMIFTDAAALTQAIDAMVAQSREQRAEIERLRTQCGGNCRYWEGRWRDGAALTTEAAAFLDGLAGHMDDLQRRWLTPNLDRVAADCRAMAERLRPAPARDR